VLQLLRRCSASSVDGDGGRHLPDSIADTDLVKVWDSGSGRGRSVYVLPAWYVVVDRATRRLHVVDPPLYRRLAAAATDALIRRWRRAMLPPSRGVAPGRTDRLVVVASTTTGVQPSQLLTPPRRA